MRTYSGAFEMHIEHCIIQATLVLLSTDTRASCTVDIAS